MTRMCLLLSCAVIAALSWAPARASAACPWAPPELAQALGAAGGTVQSLRSASDSLKSRLGTLHGRTLDEATTGRCAPALTGDLDATLREARAHAEAVALADRDSPAFLTCTADLLQTIGVAVRDATASGDTVRALRLEKARQAVVALDRQAVQAATDLSILQGRSTRILGQATELQEACR